MAKQTINLGTAPTGAGGDTVRSALVKAQANFDEIYNAGVASTALSGQASVDMNSFTTSGVYLFNTPSANSPGFDYGTIEVQPRSSGEIIQIARSIVYDIEVSRRYINSAWSPWRRVYHTGNVVGTVSQASGIPSGAIIETGTNANGTYVKFADGSMVCRGKFSMPAQALSAAVSVAATFPASFIDATYDLDYSPIATAGSSGVQSDVGSSNCNGVYLAKTASGVTFLSYSYKYAISYGVNYSYVAWGRWF